MSLRRILRGAFSTRAVLPAWMLLGIACSFVPVISSGAQEAGRHPADEQPLVPPVADPAFEVATIKPTQPDAPKPYGQAQWFSEIHSRSLSIRNASVTNLMEYSYRLRAEQIKGGPAWMNEMKFDITGQADAAVQPSRDQYRLMMRKLLAERFHLVIRETQQVSSVYALTQADGQPGMASSSSESGPFALQTKMLANGNAELHFDSATMQDFLYVLMNSIQDRQLVDETGLQGKYNFILVVPATALQDETDPGDLGAALFKAIQSIGLQLRSKRAPIKVVVVDHVEKPTPD